MAPNISTKKFWMLKIQRPSLRYTKQVKHIFWRRERERKSLVYAKVVPHFEPWRAITMKIVAVANYDALENISNSLMTLWNSNMKAILELMDKVHAWRNKNTLKVSEQLIIILFIYIRNFRFFLCILILSQPICEL